MPYPANRGQARAVVLAYLEYKRTGRALKAITPCTASTTLVEYLDGRTGPVLCELVRHRPMVKHRARLGGRQRVEWDTKSIDLIADDDHGEW